MVILVIAVNCINYYSLTLRLALDKKSVIYMLYVCIGNRDTDSRIILLSITFYMRGEIHTKTLDFYFSLIITFKFGLDGIDYFK